MVKKKSCVFISGAGTNLRALIRSSREYNYPININLVISDNKNALGLKIAKKYNIDYKIFNLKKNNQLEIALRVLKKKKISLICLAGYMKILSKKFIKRFNKRIINIHPSLLPKYKGLDTFKKVLINKEKLTGCSVHFVSEKLDSGKIILQKKIYVENNDDINSLKAKVQSKEYIAYSEAIVKLYSNISS